MKSLTWVALLVSVCSVITQADQFEVPHVSVYGTATKKIVPDILRWSITVKNSDLYLKEAAEIHTTHVSKIVQLLKEHQIPKEKIQTSRMTFGENRVYKKGNNIKEGYYASTQINFEIKDLKKYLPLWLLLSNHDVVSINHVQYDHSDRIKFQNEIRLLALVAAKKKATDLANVLNSKIAHPLLIEEIQSNHHRGSISNMMITSEMRAHSGNSDAISPGEIAIEMKIKAIFRIEPR